MRLRQALLAIFLMSGLLATGSCAEAAPSVSEDSAGKKYLCDRIAKAMTPEALMSLQVELWLDATLAAMLKQNLKFTEMEEAYPGMIAAVKDGWRGPMLKLNRQTLPLRRADFSQLYQDNLTTAEARQSLAFYESPAYQTFNAAASAYKDHVTFAQRKVPEGGVTTADIDSDLDALGTWITRSLTPAQRNKVEAFFQSPLGTKWETLKPAEDAIVTKWENYMPPDVEREIDLAISQAMVAHIAKTDPEAAAAMREQFEAEGTLP